MKKAPSFLTRLSMVVGEEGSIGLAFQPPTHHAESMTQGINA